MFWIYVPPIILLISLVALILLVWRKISRLKSRGIQLGVSEKISVNAEREGTKSKRILVTLARILENLLILLKNGFKKSEMIVSGWALKMKKGKRNTDEQSFASPGNELQDQAGFLDKIKNISLDDENRPDTDEEMLIRKEEGAGFTSGLAVLRRKKQPEMPLPKLREEPIPENKAREEALIFRIAENPKDIEAYRELGDYYLATGNIKDAKDSFKMVLKLRPRDLKAKSSLREIEMRMRLGS
ncbi:MAG: hypothetical protein WC858_00895 [Parcubacteria group bacterium]|jgi:hypothetical protein